MLPPPLLLHQRQRAARERDQRIGADVERQLEAVARRLVRRDWTVRRGGAYAAPWTTKSRPPNASGRSRSKTLRDLRVVGDVERKDQRIGEAGGQLADVFFEPFALIGQRDARARGRGRLRDRPGDRSLVGDADDEAGFSRRERTSDRPLSVSSFAASSFRAGCPPLARRLRGPPWRCWPPPPGPRPKPWFGPRRHRRRRRCRGAGRARSAGRRRRCRAVAAAAALLPRPRKPPPGPPRPLFWRIVNSGAWRSIFMPSGRGSCARISGRCTGPSSGGQHVDLAVVVDPADDLVGVASGFGCCRNRPSSSAPRSWLVGASGSRCGAASGRGAPDGWVLRCRRALPCRARRCRIRFLAARRLAAFVDVLGVARRAARLLDVFFDHRDDGVIGHAPLARTVVVQNVTETQRALLHVLTSPELS